MLGHVLIQFVVALEPCWTEETVMRAGEVWERRRLANHPTSVDLGRVPDHLFNKAERGGLIQIWFWRRERWRMETDWVDGHDPKVLSGLALLGDRCADDLVQVSFGKERRIGSLSVSDARNFHFGTS